MSEYDPQQARIEEEARANPDLWAAKGRMPTHAEALAGEGRRYAKRMEQLALEQSAAEAAKAKQRELDPWPGPTSVKPCRIAPERSRFVPAPSPSRIDESRAMARAVIAQGDVVGMLVVFLESDGSVRRAGHMVGEGIVRCAMHQRLTQLAIDLAVASHPGDNSRYVQFCAGDGSVFEAGWLSPEGA